MHGLARRRLTTLLGTTAAVTLLAAASPRLDPPPAARSRDGCTLQAVGVETQRRENGTRKPATDFYPGDEAILILCRYRMDCGGKPPVTPIQIGFQLDGTIFTSGSSAHAEHVSAYDYVVAGQVKLPTEFSPEILWPHSHGAGCQVDPAHAFAEDDPSDNAAVVGIALRPQPEPASPARPALMPPGMTLASELRFVGLTHRAPPGEGNAVAQPGGAATPSGGRKPADGPVRASGGEATSDADDLVRRLREEKTRAEDYLTRVKARAPGQDRAEDFVPDFPGIARPVHLTSVGQMENYLRMVDARLAAEIERTARSDPASTSARAAPVQPSPAGATVAGATVAGASGVLPAGMIVVRVPYRFTSLDPSVLRANLRCSISSTGSVTGVLGVGTASVTLNGGDRTGTVDVTFQPLDGHDPDDLADARSYRCTLATFETASESHAVLAVDPYPALFPLWATAAKSSVLSVEGPLQRRR